MLLGVEAGQIVVAAAATDRADLRQIAEQGLINSARVVIEAAGNGQVNRQAILGKTSTRKGVHKLAQVGDPLGSAVVIAAGTLDLVEYLGIRARSLHRRQDALGLFAGDRSDRTHLSGDLFRADFFAVCRGRGEWLPTPRPNRAIRVGR